MLLFVPKQVFLYQGFGFVCVPSWKGREGISGRRSKETLRRFQVGET